MQERSRTQRRVLRAAVLLAALSLLLVLPAVALAAGGWQAGASGTTADLSALAASGSHLWAVGAGGTIVTTLNSGSSWAAESSGSNQDLHGVAFADALHGWAVGAGGTILATSDGGATWVAQSSGTTSTLYGVACSGTQSVWAVGDGGIILASANGGLTWTPQTSGTAQTLRGVAFADATHGWAVGDGGTILATVTGGTSWASQASGTANGLAAVAFADTSHGAAVGAAGTVLSTANGGLTWALAASGSASNLTAVAFAGAARAWIVGASGTVLYSANGGGAWTSQISTTAKDLAAVAVPDAEHGVVAGGGGTVLFTADGGIRDSLPPVTTAKGLRARATSGWRNTAQTVSLKASDTGSGTAATYYTIDGGARQGYTVPFTISAAGSHLVKYWSVDWAGNSEAKHSGYVNIDLGKPTCVALHSLKTYSGTMATFAFRVNDPKPSCGFGDVRITIYKGESPVKRFKIAWATLNKSLNHSFRIALKAGTYSWVVTATDLAGNTEAKAGSAKLKVLAMPLPTMTDVQRRLVALLYLPSGAVSGKADYRTSQAIMAFQAWSGLPRDGVAGVQTRTRLANASAPKPRPEAVGGHYVEVYRSLGVALCVNGGTLVRVVHCSTGRPSLPTPAGSFSVYSKSLLAYSAEYDSWMPYASFFHAGDALHGYPEVPAYPASHGCVRLSMPEAPFVYGFATYGTPVFVY